MLEQAQCGQPGGLFVSAGRRLLGRSMRQQQAEGGEEQGCNARNDEGPFGGFLEWLAAQATGKDRSEPVDQAVGFGRIDFIPIDQNESEGPGCQNPPDGAAHTNQPEFLLRVLHVGECNRIGDRDGRDVEQAVYRHQDEKRPKRFGEAQR